MRTILLAIIFLSSNFIHAIPVDKLLYRDIKKLIKIEEFSLIPLDCNSSSKINGAFYKIECKSSAYKYLYKGRVDTFRSNSTSQQNSAEYFEYIILYDAHKIVRKIKITNYSASHGEMISSSAWLKNFIGYQPGKVLEIGKQIDAISGATLSVNKITFDIKQKSYILAKLD